MTGASPSLSSRRSLALSYFRAPENRGGFTLIELLIVVAIIAILAVIAVITLNPAQLIKQSRDSTRFQDIGTINRVIGLYQADGGTFFGTSSIVYVSIPDPAATTTAGTDCSTIGFPALPSGWTYHCAASSTYKNINGLGWIPVNFTQISFGNPLPSLPVDPINTTSTGEYYTYVTGESWELTTLIESDKYADLAVNDGDSYPGVYSKRSSSVPLTPGTRDKGMVGYWTFDEGSGSVAYDYSGTNATGSWSGTGTHYTTGKVGQYAGQFNGTDDYVDAGNGTSLNIINAITIIGWVNIKGVSLWGALIAKGEGVAYLAEIQQTTPKLRFVINGFSSALTGDTLLSLNTWYHFAATYDSSNMKLYLNGNQDGTKVFSTPINIVANSVWFGKRGGNTFEGLIDDVRIYNRALSAAEIAAIYNATK